MFAIEKFDVFPSLYVKCEPFACQEDTITFIIPCVISKIFSRCRIALDPVKMSREKQHYTIVFPPLTAAACMFTFISYKSGSPNRPIGGLWYISLEHLIGSIICVCI